MLRWSFRSELSSLERESLPYSTWKRTTLADISQCYCRVSSLLVCYLDYKYNQDIFCWPAMRWRSTLSEFSYPCHTMAGTRKWWKLLRVTATPLLIQIIHRIGEANRGNGPSQSLECTDLNNSHLPSLLRPSALRKVCRYIVPRHVVCCVPDICRPQ
jgi:hypothetical protein